jgi:hypothetical protein
MHVEHWSPANALSSDAVDSRDEHPIERLLLGDRELAELVTGCDHLRPYAVLPDTESLLTTWRRSGHLPRAGVVSRVNSKTWSNVLVHELGLPGYARVVRSVDELTVAVRESGPAAVVKDPYGVSGRGALLVTSPGVLRAIERVLRRQENEGRRVELLVQPVFPKRCDFSGHLQIERDGSVRFLGVQIMINRGFRHLGSGPAGPATLALLDRQGYPEVLAEVGAALVREGYWGPVGIDSMMLDDDTLIPVLEINARISLGLLALLAGRRTSELELTCHLWQLELAVDPGRGIEDVVATLRKKGLCYRGDARPGVVVLGGGLLAAPGGRLYGLSYCQPSHASSWLNRVTAAVETAGMRPRRGSHAA